MQSFMNCNHFDIIGAIENLRRNITVYLSFMKLVQRQDIKGNSFEMIVGDTVPSK